MTTFWPCQWYLIFCLQHQGSPDFYLLFSWLSFLYFKSFRFQCSTQQFEVCFLTGLFFGEFKLQALPKSELGSHNTTHHHQTTSLSTEIYLSKLGSCHWPSAALCETQPLCKTISPKQLPPLEWVLSVHQFQAATHLITTAQSFWN